MSPPPHIPPPAYVIRILSVLAFRRYMWDKHKKSGSNILYYPLLPPQDRYERPPLLPPFLTLFIYISSRLVSQI